MPSSLTLLVATFVLGAGTFAFRFAGPLLRARMELSPRVEKLITDGAIVLMAALIATTALLNGQEFDGVAKPAGVLVGGVLAWRGKPFVVVVVAAAGTAALLRLVGVP
jgi:branched-subunit amino acid transport protein